MKSIKTQELIDWLCDVEEIKKYTVEDVEDLIEISEIESSGNVKLLNEKIKDFKSKKRKPKRLIDIFSAL
jgi:hypothetical protein